MKILSAMLIVNMEHVSFTPLILSATGGLAHEATGFWKHLAFLLSTKWGITILEFWGGFIVAYPFHCCAQQLPVSVVLGFLLVTSTELAPLSMDLVRVSLL